MVSLFFYSSFSSSFDDSLSSFGAMKIRQKLGSILCQMPNFGSRLKK